MGNSMVVPDRHIDLGSHETGLSNVCTEKDRQLVHVAMTETNSHSILRLCKHWKLFMIILFCISAMLMLAAFSLSKGIEVNTATNEAIQSIRASLLVSNLVHKLQRERGMSTNFLGTNFSTMTTILEIGIFRGKTDASVNDAVWPQNGIKFYDKLWSSETLQVSLNEHRNLVDHREINYFYNLEFYNNLTSALIMHITQSVSIPNDAKIQRPVDASNALLSWMDDAGIQRALGTIFYTGCGWSSTRIERWFILLQGRATSFLDTATSYSQKVQIEYNTIRYSSAIAVFISNHQSNDLFTKYKMSCDSLSERQKYEKSLDWFDNMTLYIDTLFNIRKDANIDINSSLEDLHAKTEFQFILFLSTLIIAIIVSGIMSIWYAYCITKLTGSLATYVQTAKLKGEQLEKEKKKTENLLYQMMPKKIARDLKLGKPLHAEYFADVTVLFSDICGFTEISARSEPMEIIKMLNELYCLLDEYIERYDVYKVETIGDCYMVASGVPEPTVKNHAAEIARMALKIINNVKKYSIPHIPDTKLDMRTGIHSGSCVAGVVGTKMPRYCLFGDTVNTASRMESSGVGGKIQISSYTQSLLESHGNFITEYRGIRKIKGKGAMSTYWLTGVKVEENTLVVIAG